MKTKLITLTLATVCSAVSLAQAGAPSPLIVYPPQGPAITIPNATTDNVTIGVYLFSRGTGRGQMMYPAQRETQLVTRSTGNGPQVSYFEPK